jgi:hypothetical protein
VTISVVCGTYCLTQYRFNHMKTLLIAFGIAFASVSICTAATVASWSFEPPNSPPTVTGTTITGLLPDSGIGVASGVHASSSTTFSSVVGNGSATALGADHWVGGDYWQFQFSTLGFAHLQLGFDARASFSGPTNITLSYSLDGSSFTTLNPNVNVPVGTWNSSVRSLTFAHTFDLTALTALDNAPNVYIRLAANLPPFDTGNSASIDNFVVNGTVIPEPSSLALVAGVLLAGVAYRQALSARLLPRPSLPSVAERRVRRGEGGQSGLGGVPQPGELREGTGERGKMGGFQLCRIHLRRLARDPGA